MGKSKTRPHEIHLRLDEEEYQALEANRKKCNLPQQTYLRKLCCGIRPNEFPPAEYMQVMRDVQIIGNKLMSIALQARSNGWLDAERYWLEVEHFRKSFGEFLRQFHTEEEEFDGEHLQ